MPINTPPSFYRPKATGKLNFDFGNSDDRARSVLVQADGKILVAGFTNFGSPASWKFGVIRYNADGSLDTNFGQNGRVNTYQGLDATGTAISILPDGKILMVGQAFDGTNTKLIICRYNSNGEIDTSFGVSGRVFTSIPSSKVSGDSIIVQDDGKIIVAGMATLKAVDTFESDFLVARYMPNGELDTGFNVTGMLRLNFSLGYNRVDTVLLQKDGKIVVGGYSSNNNGAGIARINIDGTLDTSFGSQGKMEKTVFWGDVRGIALDDAGNIYAASNGWGPSGEKDGYVFRTARLKPDGTIDSTFGDNGIQFTNFISPGIETPNDIVVQKDGKIIVTGWVSNGINNQFAAVRYLANGDLDLSFGIEGKAIIKVGTNTTSAGQLDPDIAFKVTLQNEGKILVAGESFNGKDNDFGLIRLDSNGILDTTFGEKGEVNSLDAATKYVAGYPSILIDNDVSIFDAELSSLNNGIGNYAGASITIQRLGAINPLDEFTAAGALAFDKGQVRLSGVQVGTAEILPGSIKINFNSNATQQRVNEVISSLAYRSDPNLAEATIQLSWTFDDGNQGAQGTGNNLKAIGTTSIKVISIPESHPYWIDALLRPESSNTIRTLLSTTKNYQYALLAKAPDYGTTYGKNSFLALTEDQKTLIKAAFSYVGSLVDVKFIETDNPAQLNTLAIGNYELTDGFGASASYPGNTLIGSDINLNAFDKETLHPSAMSGFYKTFMHELGHALGLQHPFEQNQAQRVLTNIESSANNTVMSYDDTLESHAIKYGPLDIATLQYLYGVNPNTRAGDDTYQISSESSNFIWDGAGIDTISATGITLDVTLHLTSGYWDFVGARGVGITSPGQVTVNYGSRIENLIGGFGNDSLYGSEYNNSINGGSGNDTIFGGKGDDFIAGGNDKDFAQYSGPVADYTISYDVKTGLYTIHDKVDGRDGTDTLSSIEILIFKDGERLLANFLPSLPPTSENKSIELIEDNRYSMGTKDFSFRDPNPGDTLKSVVITAQPSSGSLRLNDIEVQKGQLINVDEINAGRLIFVPSINTNGSNCSNFSFRVSDGELMSDIATLSFNISPANDSPNGSLLIFGSLTQGQTLSIMNTLSDVDGMGAVSYQWQRDGFKIDSAISATYQLTQADVGRKISVTANYTDGFGTQESVRSQSTSLVTNANDAPTGSVIINGSIIQDQLLTVSNTLNDLDGMGEVSYQWQRAGINIDSANGPTYRLTQADVGKVISVIANYTDGFGNKESALSQTTPPVIASKAADLKLIGTGNDDLIEGGDGDDLIQGLSGFDTLIGGLGNDTLDGGDGADNVDYQRATSAVNVNLTKGYATGSGIGNDTLISIEEVIGSNFADKLVGSDGDDFIMGGGGDDIIQGGNGNDLMQGGVGNDTLIGGDGMDYASYFDATGPVEINLNLGTASGDGVGQDQLISMENIRGSIFNDSIVGSAANEWFMGRQGNDTITGGAGSDTFYVMWGGPSDNSTDTITDFEVGVNGDTVVIPVWQLSNYTLGANPFNTGHARLRQVGPNTLIEIDRDGSGPITFQTGVVLTNMNKENLALFNLSLRNTIPTGSVSIFGDVIQGYSLTVKNAFTDADGIGAITYQWYRNGLKIDSAISSTYQLTQVDVGTSISVTAFYTDGFGTKESVTSPITALINNVNDAPIGNVIISGSPAQDQVLSVSNTLIDADGIGPISYQWQRAGTNIDSAVGSTYRLTQADVGKTISVVASYIDGFGNKETMVSQATSPVSAITVPDLSLIGTASDELIEGGAGNDLIKGLAGRDDLRGHDGNDSLFGGPGDDFLGGGEGNDLLDGGDGWDSANYEYATGPVSINLSLGVATGGGMGQDILSSIEDITGSRYADSIVGSASSEWFRGRAGNDTITGGAGKDVFAIMEGAAVDNSVDTITDFAVGNNGDSIVLSNWEFTNYTAGSNPFITGHARLTQSNGDTIVEVDRDGAGSLAFQTIAILSNVQKNELTSFNLGVANALPNGNVVITGNATQGQALSVSHTLTDADGIGAMSYQWRRSGINIDSANSTTYSLTQDDVGQTISVVASYTDGFGNQESKVSTSTSMVLNINDIPVGHVQISGIKTQGQTLTASNTLSDIDGIGFVSYQWQRDGVIIDSANSTTYSLTQSDVGKTISVTASYTDGFGTKESKVSLPTSAISNINDTPTGAVIISGIANQGQTLTATNNLSDIDGIGAITYQWYRNGLKIDSAISSTYQLTQVDVGTSISVTAFYTDGFGTKEFSVSESKIVGTTITGDTGDNVFQASNGSDVFDGGPGFDVVSITAPLHDFSLKKIGSSYIIKSKNGSNGVDTLSNIELIKFSDMSVNLTIQAKAAAALQADVQKLIELYVAFFSRVPDAGGLAYWIDQMNGGLNINQVAESFYHAGIQYSDITGFSANMSNTEFINVIYKNVLGRSEGADAGGLAYWNGELSNGHATRGNLVSTILNAAHGFKGDTTWGFVADLLDNKIAVAKLFAIDWGLSYNTDAASIVQGKAIAAAITPSDTLAALALVGINPLDMTLG